MTSGTAGPTTVINRLLERVSKDELASLTPHMVTVFLAHGQQLIAPREPIRDIYFPTTALASLVTVLDDGSTIEAGSVGREGMVGIPFILGTESTPMETIAQIEGEAIRIKASAVKEVYDRGKSLHSLLNRYVHTCFVVASQSAACNRRHQVSQRLARWLLMSSDGIGSSEVGLTHEYLAAMLGVRRSGVTEAALKLQEAGMIQYRRGGIRIVDRDALAKTACECYHLVRQELDALLGDDV